MNNKMAQGNPQRQESGQNGGKQDYEQVNVDSYPEMHWDTVFTDDKFYMAHPLELDRLLKLEAELKIQKNRLGLNSDLQGVAKQQNDQDRTEKSQLDNYRPLSGLSRDCKTQINQIKDIKQRIKAEQELLGEEEKYQQRLAEIKRKKQSKHPQILSKERGETSEKSQNKPVRQKAEEPMRNSQKLSPENKQRASQKKQDKKQASVDEEKNRAPDNHERNYISFHPNEAITSPKFEMNKTRTAKFVEQEPELSDKSKSNLRYSANNTSKLANKSFVVNLRKTPSNSKEPREPLSNSKRDIKSASSAASKLQIQLLNRKIKEMQEKLANVEQKQKQFQQIQKSRVLPVVQAFEHIKAQQEKVTKSQKNGYEQELKESEVAKHQLQKSGRMELNNLHSNKSSANDGEVRKSKQSQSKDSQAFDLTIYKTKKLNLISSAVAYNYSEDYARMKKEAEQVNEREKMSEEIGQLKKVIRQLKLERIKHEAMIEELERKQKQKNASALLSSKLDQGSPEASRVSKVRLPTEKRQKTEPKEATIFEQSSPKQRVGKPQLQIEVESQQQKGNAVDANLNLMKKQKLKPLKLQSNNSKGDSSKFETSGKLGINSKQLISSSANPEDSSFRQFHPYPLNRRGIVVRQVLDNQEKESPAYNRNKNHSVRDRDRDNSYEPPSPAHTGRKIFELEFVKQTKKQTQVREQEVDLTPPQLDVRAFNIPKLPVTPTCDINQTELLGLAKYICNVFGIKVQSDDHIYMKKYKNCIIFKTPDAKRTVVWHYSGKFYIGGWDQNEQGEGKKNGEGFQFVPDKHYYQGQFLEGKKNGSGTMVMLNGNIYKGQWVKGQKQGLGTYYEKASGAIYQGEWKEDKKEGKGVLKISQNQFYDGTFVKSVKHGYGLEVFNNGDYYKGQYKIGRFHGKGKYAWKNGACYDGNFVEGRREGMGRWRSSNREFDVYLGEYKNDKKSGKGQYTWSNGTVYEGHFINDLKHGEGRVEYPDGREIRGYWDSGKLVEVDQNIEESETSSHRNEPLPRPMGNKVLQISSKELQPSRKLTKL